MDLKQINSIKRIRDLKPITPLRPITPVRPITPLTLDNTYLNKVRVIKYKPKTADSFADVLLGSWDGTLQLRNLLDEYDLGDLKDIPLVNKLVGSLLLVDKQFIKPVRVNKLDGFKEVGLNTLINASETLDVFANLVKSQFSGAGGSPGIDSLEDALGIGDTKERKVYNWNTGTFVGDLLLEIISDPLNWVSYGVTAVEDVAATTVLKGAKEITEATIKSNMDNVAKAFGQVISKESLDDLTTVSAKRITKSLLGDTPTKLKYADDILPALKRSTITEIDDLANKLTSVKIVDDLDVALSDSFTMLAATQAKSLRQYRAALQFKNGFKHYVEQPINTLGYVNILGPYHLLKLVPFDSIFAKIHNNLVMSYNKYSSVATRTNSSDITDKFAGYVLSQSNALFSKQLEPLKKSLKELGIPFKKLQYNLLLFFKMNNIVLDTKNPKIDLETRQNFISWLSKNEHFKELFNDKAKSDLLKAMFIDNFNKDAQDVIDLFALGPAILQYSENMITQSKNAIRLQRTLNNYKHNKFVPVTYKKGKRKGKLRYDEAGVPRATVKENPTILDKFRYLNKTILRSGSGKEYGLAKLPDFIKDCMFPRNKLEAIPLKQQAIIAQILNDLGVTKTNYILIADVINNTKLKDATKIKRIYKIVSSTSDDPRFLDYTFVKELTESSKKYAKQKVNSAVATIFNNMRKASSEVKLPNKYKPIKNLQDAYLKIMKNNRKLFKPAMRSYLSDILKTYQFMDSSKLHRDLKVWTGLHLDEEYVERITDIVDYISSTEDLLAKVLDLSTWEASAFAEFQEQFSTWYNKLSDIIESLDALDEYLPGFVESATYTAEQGKAFAVMVGFLKDTRGVVNELTNSHLPEDLINFLDDFTDIYYTQLSHKGMFDLIMQHTNLTNSSKKYGRFTKKQVMQELINPNSYMRKKVIPELVQLYKQAGLTHQAQYLEEAMAQIDITTALQKLLNSDLNLEFLSDADAKYCINLLFDAIKNSNVFIGNIFYSDSEAAFKDALRKIKYNIDRKLNPVDSKKYQILINKKPGTNKSKFHRTLQIQRKVHIDEQDGVKFVNTDDLILIKLNPSKNDVYKFLKGNDFHSLETKYISEAYAFLVKSHAIPENFSQLLNSVHDRKLFLTNIGINIHKNIDIVLQNNPQLSVADALTQLDWVKILKDSIESLQTRATRLDTIMDRLELLLQNYLHDIRRIPLNDFPIYSLYSLDTIKQLNLVINNYTNIITELTNTPKPVIAEATVLMEYLQTFAEAIQDGLDVVIRGTSEMSDYINNEKAKTYLFNKHSIQNIFDASTASGIFGTKKVYYEDVDKFFGLTPDSIKGTNAEKRMLNNKLHFYLNNTDTTTETYNLLNNTEYVETMRAALIATYSRKNILFEFVDAEAYFNSLNPTQLYYWDRLTKGNLSKNNRRFYKEFINQISIERSINLNTITSEFYSNLEMITEGVNKNFTSDDAFTPVINIMQTMDYGSLSAYVDETFLSIPKSVDELGEYQSQISEFIDEDIRAKNRMLKGLKHLDLDPNINLTTDDKVDMLIERKTLLARSVADMHPADLRVYIDRNTPGALFFYNEDLVEITTKEGDKYWTGLEKVFDYPDEEFARHGLKKVELDDGWIVIYTIDDDPVAAGSLSYFRPEYTQTKAQEELTAILEENVDYLNLDDMDVPLDMTTVEVLPESLWTAIHEDPEFAEALSESLEQQLYQNGGDIPKNKFFNKSYSRINYTIIGGPNALEAMQARCRTSEEFIRYSKDIIKHTKSGLLSFINRSNRIKKYLALFFNKDFSAGSSLFYSAFNDLSDKELAEFFARGDYKALVLRADKTNQPLVLDYIINNHKTLKQAIKDGVIIVPKDTATAIKQVVNNRQLDYSLWSLYKRLVVPLYKGLYLMTIGFPFRNLLDSAIYKNATELGLSKAVKNDLTAIKMLRFHNEIQTKALALSNNQTLNKKNLLEILKEYSEEEQRAYFLIDLFVDSSASSGFSDSFKKYLEQYNKVDDVRKAWEIVYNDKIINGEKSPIRIINDLNNVIEQTSRLGLFLGYLDSGLKVPDAIKKVNLTHFNYSDRTPFLEFIENIFWFSTFPINNLHYYMNKGLQNNPMLLRTLVDTQTVSWNNGEYTYEELKKTNFLSYHALAGNIRIGNTILKISPSVFDVIGIMTDPINNITDRLNPFLSMPKDIIEAQANDKLYLDLIPGSTQINNAIKVYNTLTGVKEESLIPSVYSRISNSKYSGPKYYVNKTRGTFANWTKYPKLKRPRRFYNISSKYYAKQYRWMYNKNIRNYFRYHDDARYLMQRSGKRKTINQLNGIRYNRAIRFFKTQRRFTKA